MHFGFEIGLNSNNKNKPGLFDIQRAPKKLHFFIVMRKKPQCFSGSTPILFKRPQLLVINKKYALFQIC